MPAPDERHPYAAPANATSDRPPSAAPHDRTPPSGPQSAFPATASTTTQSPHIQADCPHPTSKQIQSHTTHSPQRPTASPPGSTADPYAPHRSPPQPAKNTSHRTYKCDL